MEFTVTKVLKEQEVDQRLAELGLNKPSLITAAQAAIAAHNDSTAHDPLNAPGTLSYIYGTRKLRDEFVGKNWVLDRTEHVEAIKNEKLGVKVIFQNVDIACSEVMTPNPRSKKGAGSERVCEGNLFENLPIPVPAGKWKTFYLMLAIDGALELSQPIVRLGKFDEFIERLFLITPDEVDLTVNDNHSEQHRSNDDFDIEITRKSS